MGHAIYDPGQEDRPAWNVGRKLGAKRPLLPKQVWAVRFFLEQEHRFRDRALFDVAIDSKLRGCDLVKIKKVADQIATLQVASSIHIQVQDSQASSQKQRACSQQSPERWPRAQLGVRCCSGGVDTALCEFRNLHHHCA